MPRGPRQVSTESEYGTVSILYDAKKDEVGVYTDFDNLGDGARVWMSRVMWEHLIDELNDAIRMERDAATEVKT